MSNSIITDVSAMMASSVSNLTSQIDSSSSKVSETGEFSKVMSDANMKIANANNDGNVANTPARNTTLDKSSTKEIKNDSATSKDVSNNAEDRKEVAKKAMDSAEKVYDKVKNELGVSDEEIESAMETLNLSMQDLLDPTKLKDLMLEISGITDSISLITNAEVYNAVKDCLNFAMDEVKVLTEDLGISNEDLADVLGDSELFNQIVSELENVEADNNISTNLNTVNQMNNTDVIDNNAVVTNDSNVVEVQVTNTTDNVTSTIANVDENGDVAVNVDVVVTNSVQNDKNTVSSNTDSKVNVNALTNDNSQIREDASDVKGAELGGTETFTQAAKAETDPMKGRNEGFEHAMRFNRSETMELNETSEMASFGETVTTQTQINNVGDIVETVTSYSSVDGREIVSQVTESIRVNYAEDTTSLEMQLHPASLGTVNVQVASTNGVVTAHIVVENEAVKAALESQLVQLTQTFEEQGHKVEAVEVSVGNYDFNQSMNRDNSQNDSERQQKESFRINGARRRINISDLAEVDEAEATEEERIARDMMARNGNSIDYTV